MNYFIKTKQALTRECWELKFYQSKTWAGLGMIMRVIPALLYQPHLVCLAHSWVAQFTILRIKSLAHPPSLQHRCTRGNTHICNTYLFDTASNLNWVLHNSSNWGVYHKPNYVHRLASLFIFVFVFVFALVFVLVFVLFIVCCKILHGRKWGVFCKPKYSCRFSSIFYTPANLFQSVLASANHSWIVITPLTDHHCERGVLVLFIQKYLTIWTKSFSGCFLVGDVCL